MNDTTWISKLSPAATVFATDLLEEVCDGFDMARVPLTIAARPYPIGLGQDEAALAWRKEFLGMLKVRGVLTDFEFVPYVDPTERERWRIVADEATVRETLRLLQEHMDGPPAPPPVPSAPAPPPAPVPPPPPAASAPIQRHDPFAEDVKKTHRIERARLPYVVAAALIVAAVVTGLKWGAQWWAAVAHPRNPAAAESTAVKVPATKPPASKSPAPAESTATNVDHDSWMGGV